MNDNDVKATNLGGDTQKRPFIVVAPRWQPWDYERNKAIYPEPLEPEETITSNYFNALLDVGTLPVMMPLTQDQTVLDYYLAMADGLAIQGGPDVDPALWGATDPYDEKLLCRERDAVEMYLIRRAREMNLPMLAICRGLQIMNVAFGGSLCMDVPSFPTKEGMLRWRHDACILKPAHPVDISEGSVLAKHLGAEQIQVNSSHHCCVDKLGEGLAISAYATDGVPEAIEVAERDFFIGVQWHPEYTWSFSAKDRMLWKEFASAAERYRKNRSA